ncbi:hypothetical protein ACLKA7_017219 [Drosophila subpalustris]
MADCKKSKKKKSWRRVYEQAIDYWQVLRYQKHPKHSSIYYNRLQLSVLCIYPNQEERRSPIRRIWHKFVLAQIVTFSSTLLCALPESSDNIVNLGQDLLWIIGTFYLIFKWHFLYFCADNVDEVIDEIDKCHRELKNERTANEIRAQQRNLFLVESTLGLGWHIGIAMFNILALSQPVWTKQKLPFHAVYPFEWHDPEKHPFAHVFVYVYQCFVLNYNMTCILYTDLLSSHIFTQLGCNLKIMCLELQGLSKLSRENEQLFRQELYRLVDFHQRIISLVDRVNKVFYAPMIMQMVAAFLLVSLSTFVSLVARHDPTVAARFVIFMILSFLHLSYWCFAGDMVTEQSQKVALAAYDVYNWSPHKPQIQRDVMFVMQRAQLPLSMAASPFPPFNLFSYMAILKQCYSILTVLLESLD